MAIDADIRATQAAPVDQACVAEAIGEDQSAAADQCGNGADVGEVAGAKRQGGFGALEPREGLLKLQMRGE